MHAMPATANRRVALNTTDADAFWDALNRTYSDSRHCDVDRLPDDIQRLILGVEVEVECSSYTVGDHAAFLRGTVDIGGEEFDFEVSYGSIQNEEMYGEDGDWDEDEHGDEDEYYQSVAEELHACSEAGALTVYFTRA